METQGTKLYEKSELKVTLDKEDILLTIDTKGVDIVVKVDGEYLLKELMDIIPGQIDDAVINIIIAALKAR